MAKGPVPGSNRGTASRRHKPAKGTRKLRSMRIAKAHGGFVANHEYENGDDGAWQPGEEHVISGGKDALMKHVGAHFDDEPAANRQESGEQAGGKG